MKGSDKFGSFQVGLIKLFVLFSVENNVCVKYKWKEIIINMHTFFVAMKLSP